MEEQIRRVRQQAGDDILRVGEPTISRVAASVTGDKASLVACPNEDEWGAEQNGEPMEAESLGDVPVGAELERRGGGWTLVETMKSDQAAMTEDCG